MAPAKAGARQWQSPDDDTLLRAYAEHMARLQLVLRARYNRQQGARRLLQRLHGLDWHDASVTVALRDVDACASAFIPFLLLFGYLRPGYPYLFSRKLTKLVLESAVSPLAGDAAAVRETAERLRFSKRHIEQFLPTVVLRLLVQTGKPLYALTHDDLEAFRTAAEAWGATSGYRQNHWTHCLLAVENVLYQMGVLDHPGVSRLIRPRTWAERLAGVPQQELRTCFLRYVTLVAANRRPATVVGYCAAFVSLAGYLAEHAPAVRRLSDLHRQYHIEPWLVWNAARRRRLPDGTSRPVGAPHVKSYVLDIKLFLDTITEWGWEEAPARRLLFNSDLPKLDQPLPRYIPREQELRLMAAIRELPDPFQRYPLEILRATGMRIGELLDLELDCLHEVPRQGTWLKVPMGKLHTERMVPVSDETAALFDAVVRLRGAIRPLPHPETGRPTEFLFVRRGRRIGDDHIRVGLGQAVRAAGLVDADGKPLRITPHQLRHTFATALVNGGITVQALMRLLGHVSAEMSLRYGHLFDATVRQQYQDALVQVKQRYDPAMLAVPIAGPADPPDDHWIEAHRWKTRLAHGYSHLDLTRQPCPLANVCERCPAFVPLAETEETIRRQLHDVQLLVRDAQARGWDLEAKRHRDVAERLQVFLHVTPEAAATTRQARRRA